MSKMNKYERLELANAFNEFCNIHKMENYDALTVISWLNTYELVDREKCLKLFEILEEFRVNVERRYKNKIL